MYILCFTCPLLSSMFCLAPCYFFNLVHPQAPSVPLLCGGGTGLAGEGATHRQGHPRPPVAPAPPEGALDPRPPSSVGPGAGSPPRRWRPCGLPAATWLLLDRPQPPRRLIAKPPRWEPSESVQAKVGDPRLGRNERALSGTRYRHPHPQGPASQGLAGKLCPPPGTTPALCLLRAGVALALPRGAAQ